MKKFKEKSVFMKIISFNIRYIDDPDGNSISERSKRLKAILDKYDADIFCFQEVSPYWLPELQSNFSEEYDYICRFRSPKGPEATPVFWKKDRFKFEKTGYFWFSDTPEIESGGWDEMGFNRISNYARLTEKISGNKFTVLSTHYGFGEENQIKSSKLLLNFVKSENRPCIFTGDFNIPLSSPAYKTLVDTLTDANMATVKDLRPTFHAYGREKEKGEHIDYCFITSDTLKAEGSKMIDDMVDGKYPSDHYGLLTEVSFIK